RLCPLRAHRGFGLQTRALARHGADATAAQWRSLNGTGNPAAYASLILRGGWKRRLEASAFDELEALVENPQHALQFVAALHDQPACGDDRIGALLLRQLRVLLDAEKRHLACPAKDGEHGAVAQMVDGIVAPRAGGDHAAIDVQDFAEFMPVETDGSRSRTVERNDL